jgi:hypothetical protein
VNENRIYADIFIIYWDSWLVWIVFFYSGLFLFRVEALSQFEGCVCVSGSLRQTQCKWGIEFWHNVLGWLVGPYAIFFQFFCDANEC